MQPAALQRGSQAGLLPAGARAADEHRQGGGLYKLGVYTITTYSDWYK